MEIPTCNLACDAELPVIDFSECNPEIALSEIKRIFVAKIVAASFADWTAPEEWATRVSKTSVTGDDYIRALTVVGDMPVPTRREKEISNGRKITIGKDRVLNFEIDESTADNYAFLRQLECGSGKYKVWVETMGNKLFGGNDGIEMTLKLDLALDRGKDGIERYVGVGEWENKFSPEQTISPVA